MSRRSQNWTHPHNFGLTLAIIGQLGFVTDGERIGMTLLCGKDPNKKKKQNGNEASPYK